MSESNTTGSTGTTGAQTAATQSTSNPGTHQTKPGTQKPNSRSTKSGQAGSSPSTDAQSNTQGQSPGTGGEDTQPKFQLPDELDFDTLDEESLKKLSKWKKKIKVDGKEISVPLLEAMRHMQKDLGADKRMKEGVEALRKSQQIEARLKNPATVAAALEELGLDVDDLAKQRISARLQFEALTQEQRDAYIARQEAAQYKAQVEQIRQQQEQARAEQFKAQRSEYWQKNLVETMQKSGLPADPLSMKLAAQMILANRQAGDKDYSAEDAMPMVKEFCSKLTQARVKTMPVADLFKEMGDEWGASVRKYLLDQVQNPIKEGFKQEPGGAVDATAEVKNRGKTLSPDQYAEQLRKKFG